MGKLVIESLQKKLKLKKLAKSAYTVLRQKAKIKAELVFETEEGIQILNKRERGVDRVTDVLSFPTLEGIRGAVLNKKDCFTEMDGGYIFIGSIVLCEEKIKEQAAEIGHSEERETEYLIIHGILHLFGYDHMTEEDKAEMRAKEKEILALMGETDEGENTEKDAAEASGEADKEAAKEAASAGIEGNSVAAEAADGAVNSEEKEEKEPIREEEKRAAEDKE